MDQPPSYAEVIQNRQVIRDSSMASTNCYHCAENRQKISKIKEEQNNERITHKVVTCVLLMLIGLLGIGTILLGFKIRCTIKE